MTELSTTGSGSSSGQHLDAMTPVHVGLHPDDRRFLDLHLRERKVYSQHGEDGVIEYLFSVIQPVAKFALEIGVWDAPEGVQKGEECNTRALLEWPDWAILQIDDAAPADHLRIKREFVTVERLKDLLTKYQVPERFALFSLDIDGVDYWIWKAMPPRFRPQVVVIEYNAMFPNAKTVRIVPYIPDFRWDYTSWSGASLGAMVQLAEKKGYGLVHCTETNAFFVACEYLGGAQLPSPQDIYDRQWGWWKAPDPGEDPHVAHGSMTMPISSMAVGSAISCCVVGGKRPSGRISSRADPQCGPV